MVRILELLFGCRHRRESWPQRRRAPAANGGRFAGPPYVVCLDCGREREHTLFSRGGKQMKTPRTREEADALLKRKCEIAIALKHIEARMNTRIQQAKDAAGDAAAPLQAEQAGLDTALEAFFLAERPRLGKARSLKLTFGRLGLRARRAIEYVRGWDEARVVMALAAANLSQFIRTRLTINREAVHDADETKKAELLECGLKVERGETFFCEPDLAALADHHTQAA